MAAKALFAAIPLRAIGDRELTDGDLRVLASIAAFDRLSHSKGKGQGAWASHRLMSGWIDRNYSNFSATVNKLIKAGYLVREPRETDKRQHTYRIVYTVNDRLPKAQDFVRPEANDFREIVCPETGEVQKVVCPDPQSTDGNSNKISPEYIPQSGERYSVETGERNSAKRHDFAVARRSGDSFRDHLPSNFADLSVGARVSIVERAWKAIDRDPSRMADDFERVTEWLNWLTEDVEDESVRQQASRIYQEMEYGE